MTQREVVERAWGELAGACALLGAALARVENARAQLIKVDTKHVYTTPPTLTVCDDPEHNCAVGRACPQKKGSADASHS